MYTIIISTGVWLGDPYGREGVEKILIPGFTTQQVRAVDTKSKTPTKLALTLLDVFFTREKLAKSLCTRWEGREQLDPMIIEGIRCEC